MVSWLDRQQSRKGQGVTTQGMTNTAPMNNPRPQAAAPVPQGDQMFNDLTGRIEKQNQDQLALSQKQQGLNTARMQSQAGRMGSGIGSSFVNMNQQNLLNTQNFMSQQAIDGMGRLNAHLGQGVNNQWGKEANTLAHNRNLETMGVQNQYATDAATVANQRAIQSQIGGLIGAESGARGAVDYYGGQTGNEGLVKLGEDYQTADEKETAEYDAKTINIPGFAALKKEHYPAVQQALQGSPIFAKAGLSAPKTWSEFVKLYETDAAFRSAINKIAKKNK